MTTMTETDKQAYLKLLSVVFENKEIDFNIANSRLNEEDDKLY